MDGIITFKFDGRQETALVVSQEKLEKEIIPNTYGLSEPVKLMHEYHNGKLYGGITNGGNYIFYAVMNAA